MTKRTLIILSILALLSVVLIGAGYYYYEFRYKAGYTLFGNCRSGYYFLNRGMPFGPGCYKSDPNRVLDDGYNEYQEIICLSSTSSISTPGGTIPVINIKEGSIVWTITKDGQKVAVPVLKTSKASVPRHHKMIHIIFDNTNELRASLGHPTVDSRSVDQLQVGETYNGQKITNIAIEEYADTFTYDILPAGDTGYYWANGILLASTLK